MAAALALADPGPVFASPAKSAQPTLGKYANNCVSPGQGITEWDRRRYSRRHSELRRVRDCGVKRWRPEVEALCEAGRVAYRGVVHCSSVWCCERCAARIRAARAAEHREPLVEWVRAGGGAVFVTLTLRHTLSQSLAEVLDLVVEAWRATLGARRVRALRESLRFEFLRALEVTDSDSFGWHVHLHVVVVVPEQLSTSAFRDVAAAFSSSWREAVVSRGGHVSATKGVKSENVGLGSAGRVAAYLSKLGKLTDELARGTGKLSRGKGRGFLDMLSGAASGDRRLRARWAEYERTMSGRRALVPSRGWRRLLGVGRGRSDQELAEPARDLASFGAISPRQWDWVVSAPRGFEVLESALLAGVPLPGALAQVWELLEPGDLPAWSPDAVLVDIRAGLRAEAVRRSRAPVQLRLLTG